MKASDSPRAISDSGEPFDIGIDFSVGDSGKCARAGDKYC